MASTYISILPALSAVNVCLILLSVNLQLALVDQYKAVLGVHGLHHLTVQALQTQALRVPGTPQTPGLSVS